MAHSGTSSLVMTMNDGTTKSRTNVSDLEMMLLLAGNDEIAGDSASISITTLDDGGVSRTVTFNRANGQSQSDNWA